MNISKIVLSILFALSATPLLSLQPNFLQQADSLRMAQWVDSVFNTLSLSEKIGQLFIIGVDPSASKKNQETVRKQIQTLHVGGLLFTKGSTEEQARSTAYYQQATRTPLLITLDGEWGLSMRLSPTPQFPKNILLGAIQNDTLLYQYGQEVAKECRAMGIHVNFAPVLDANTNPQNPVIGYRSFGEDPIAVANKAIAYGRGLESEGIISVGKHFPGHGDTSDDSHHTLPVLNHPIQRLDSIELTPFRAYIQAGLSGMMVGHLSVPAFDKQSGIPATLSASITDTLLQQQLQFEGLIFTDALEMKGVSSQPDLALRALLAGNDLLLKPLQPAEHIRALKEAVQEGKLSESLIDAKCKKILRYKYRCGLYQTPYTPSPELIEQINSSESEHLIRQLYQAGITLLGNETNTVPLQAIDQRNIAIVSLGENKPTRFDQFSAYYATVTSFQIGKNTLPEQWKAIREELQEYNTLIVTLHSTRSEYIEKAVALCKAQNAILVLFTQPYALLQFNESHPELPVILAYENTPFAQEYAAQLLFGGIGARGKLPVTLGARYPKGSGHTTQATRLGYDLPEAVGLNSQTLHQIDTIVANAIHDQAFPGCQILVARRGKVVYHKAFGHFDYTNEKNVDLTDLYDIASLTKVTATLPVLMNLYDNGAFQLTDKLSLYLPELRKTDKADLTLQELLYHESGLPASLSLVPLLIDSTSYTSPLFQRNPSPSHKIKVDKNLYLNKDAKTNNQYIALQSDSIFSLQIGASRFIAHNLPDSIYHRILSQPLGKKKYRYSCLNFVLLRHLIEKLTGESLAQTFDTHFAKPLGMQSTYLPTTQGFSIQQIAPTENDPLYRKQQVVGYPHDELCAFSGGIEGNAGLFSNANSLAKLLQLYLNNGTYGGNTYLSPKTTQEFTQSKNPHSRRGLGFDKPDPTLGEKGSTCRACSSNTYGHTGFTGCCFWVDPQQDLIYIFLTNRIYPDRSHKKLMTQNIRPHIQAIIYNALLEKK